MSLHRELFKDLPPAEELLKNYKNFLDTARDADGYYYLVQEIAEKYGELAYELAEEVFEASDMKYDPVLLRTRGVVRRSDYAFDGINVYDIRVRRYEPGMERDIVRLYNREIRKISWDALMDEDYFLRNIAGKFDTEGLFAAYNQNDKAVGYVHCCSDISGSSIEALFFLPGRIHECVGKILLESAKKYFAAKGESHIRTLTGRIDYPFYTEIKADRMGEFQSKLGHITDRLKDIDE